ncbi:MAG: hypothetical protein H6993_09550 [Pseudomonadales bacterium]|nr:hypothetical protein [Pseudomonadales bacterium]
MSVDSFDPATLAARLTPDIIGRLVQAAEHLEADMLGLDEAESTRLAGVARHGKVDWAAAATGLSEAELVALIKVFTVAEKRLPGWEAAAGSPVIPLAKELRRRGAWPADMTAWIRARSDNRFLPYGSLMDRL